MHERTAAVVRTAIDQTIDQLEGLDAGTPLSDMLVAHLGVMLTIESRMLAVAPKSNELVVTTTTALWYPDDSGAWIETNRLDPGLPAGTRVWYLTFVERKYGVHHEDTRLASRISWDKVVAYKVVREQPAANEKPWYPDDSGSWVETHGVDPELSDRLRVQILAEIERDRKMHIPTAFLPSVVNWPRIVAYKVVSS